MVVGQQQYGKYHHWIDRADLLKANARFLQLQLRDRLRVAVGRHLHRRRCDDDVSGRFSAAVSRWLHRARNLRRASPSSPSSSSSSVFFHKRVSKDIFAEDSTVTRMLQAVAVPVLGNVCHVFMHGLNRVQIYGAEKLHEALQCRAKDKPLITVSNHVASMDDPLVIASLLPPRVLMDAQKLRWTLCATDRCFKNPMTSAFFRSVKVLPVSRGDGIYQKGLDMAIAKLNSGGWVLIFPEGTRSRDGGKTVQSAKRGVARLVLDADNIPIVVPFVHTGMQEIMPIGANIPRAGKTVTILVGDPIEFDDLLNTEGAEFASRGNLYDAVSSRIGHRLQELKIEVDRLALEQSRRMKELALESMGRAAGMLQQIDWESFGMNACMSPQDNTVAQQSETLAVQEAVLPHQEALSHDIDGTRFVEDGGLLSRIRSVRDPSEHMGFAARGLLQSLSRGVSENCGQLIPLRTWKQFLEANCGRTVLLC